MFGPEIVLFQANFNFITTNCNEKLYNGTLNKSHNYTTKHTLQAHVLPQL